MNQFWINKDRIMATKKLEAIQELIKDKKEFFDIHSIIDE